MTDDRPDDHTIQTARVAPATNPGRVADRPPADQTRPRPERELDT